MGSLYLTKDQWDTYAKQEHLKQMELCRNANERMKLLRNTSIWSREINKKAMNLKDIYIKLQNQATDTRNELFKRKMKLSQPSMPSSESSIQDVEKLLAEDKEYQELVKKLEELNNTLLPEAKFNYELEAATAKKEEERIQDFSKQEDMRLDLERNNLEQDLAVIKQMKDGGKDGFGKEVPNSKPNFNGV